MTSSSSLSRFGYTLVLHLSLISSLGFIFSNVSTYSNSGKTLIVEMHIWSRKIVTITTTGSIHPLNWTPVVFTYSYTGAELQMERRTSLYIRWQSVLKYPKVSPSQQVLAYIYICCSKIGTVNVLEVCHQGMCIQYVCYLIEWLIYWLRRLYSIFFSSEITCFISKVLDACRGECYAGHESLGI